VGTECACGMASWHLLQGEFESIKEICFYAVDRWLTRMFLISHPFLAKVIETVVNNIRNRFTSVDVMNTMCPGPLDFDTLLSYDLLFTS